jgi:secreted trypsin-like serine protease
MLWLSVIILLSTIRSSHQTNYSCSASASCGCSSNSAIVTRIIGGQNASPATWGWAVSISIANTYLCGGSIISSSWVITAAHCVNGVSASQVTIYAGSITRFSGTQTRTGSYVIVNPNYNSQLYTYDIALVLLDSPLDMNDPDVSLICLPSVSAATLAAGEWPAPNTSVSNSLTSLILCNVCFLILFNRLLLLDGV